MFETDDVLSKADAVAAAVGQGEDLLYSKSTSLQVQLSLWMHCHCLPAES